jgi:hypothetical protein
MSNMSLSAYVMGFEEQRATTAPPVPPQPDLNDILPQGVEGLVSDTTNIQLLDFVERDVDIIEGDDF